MKYYMSFLVIAASLLISCSKCKDVACLNGGGCSDGSCVCANGFSGDKCEIEDKCVSNSVHCEHGKTCTDGRCDCGEWYTGDDCGTKVTETYAGFYSGYWNCPNNPNNNSYLVGIKDLEDQENKVLISETGTGREYEAEFVNRNNFTIHEQEMLNHTVTGEGSFSATGKLTLVMNYSYPNQGTSTTNCIFNSY